MLLYPRLGHQSFSAQSTIDYYGERARQDGLLSRARSGFACFWLQGWDIVEAARDQTRSTQLTSLEQWVENGKAPGVIVASHRTEGKLDRTRPLCPYPQVAKYQGPGSIDEAANFTCLLPQCAAWKNPWCSTAAFLEAQLPRI